MRSGSARDALSFSAECDSVAASLGCGACPSILNRAGAEQVLRLMSSARCVDVAQTDSHRRPRTHQARRYASRTSGHIASCASRVRTESGIRSCLHETTYNLIRSATTQFWRGIYEILVLVTVRSGGCIGCGRLLAAGPASTDDG